MQNLCNLIERAIKRVSFLVFLQVGYSMGFTPNPTYEEVCSGKTGHAEVVRVIYNPDLVSYETLLALFWDNHDPTQGMQQGIDVGTQYRSGIYYTDDQQKELAEQSLALFQEELDKINHGRTITTEIKPAREFYYAEEYHQQYLHKNPEGFCGLGNVGATCPRGLRKK